MSPTRFRRPVSLEGLQNRDRVRFAQRSEWNRENRLSRIVSDELGAVPTALSSPLQDEESIG